MEASSQQIKEAYKKLVLLHHPDKNPNTDPEVFSLVSVAYKVLKREETRNKYNNYLISKKKKTTEFINFKESYNSYEYDNKLNEEDSKKDFIIKMQELNNKHNYVEDNTPLDLKEINDKVSQVEMERNNINYNYPKIFKDSKDFNSELFNDSFDKFKNGEETLNKNNQNIIKIDENLVPKASNGIGDDLTQFCPINEIGQLYAEDNEYHSDTYSTLNDAFTIRQINKNISTQSVEEKLALRNKETDNLKNLKLADFRNDKDFSIFDNIYDK